MDLDNDPNELSGKPRELFFHRKLTRYFPEKRNFVKYITHSYHHSSNQKRYKMCRLDGLYDKEGGKADSRQTWIGLHIKR